MWSAVKEVLEKAVLGETPAVISVNDIQNQEVKVCTCYTCFINILRNIFHYEDAYVGFLFNLEVDLV